MTNTLRYGMIGCGMMGQEHLRNIRLLPDTRITAILEPDAAMAAAASALAPEATLCADLYGLLAQRDLDCLVISSPNQLHLDQLEAIAATRALPMRPAGRRSPPARCPGRANAETG